MIRLWRICKKRYHGRAFQGEGARREGGRWNRPGLPVVYTSGSAALATLEMLVHLEDAQLLGSYVLIPARIGEDLVETLPLEALPPNWRQYPATEGTQAIGDAWVRDTASVALFVPSVVVPGENILLNPEHPDFGEVDIGDPVDWDHDPRLLGTHELE